MKPNVGDEASFKLTEDERNKIAVALLNYISNNRTSTNETIDCIEDIINQGWQNCDCELTQTD